MLKQESLLSAFLGTRTHPTTFGEKLAKCPDDYIIHTITNIFKSSSPDVARLHELMHASGTSMDQLIEAQQQLIQRLKKWKADRAKIEANSQSTHELTCTTENGFERTSLLPFRDFQIDDSTARPLKNGSQSRSPAVDDQIRKNSCDLPPTPHSLTRLQPENSTDSYLETCRNRNLPALTFAPNRVSLNDFYALEDAYPLSRSSAPTPSTSFLAESLPEFMNTRRHRDDPEISPIPFGSNPSAFCSQISRHSMLHSMSAPTDLHTPLCYDVLSKRRLNEAWTGSVGGLRRKGEPDCSQKLWKLDRSSIPLSPLERQPKVPQNSPFMNTSKSFYEQPGPEASTPYEMLQKVAQELERDPMVRLKTRRVDESSFDGTSAVIEEPEIEALSPRIEVLPQLKDFDPAEFGWLHKILDNAHPKEARASIESVETQASLTEAIGDQRAQPKKQICELHDNSFVKQFIQTLAASTQHPIQKPILNASALDTPSAYSLLGCCPVESSLTEQILLQIVTAAAAYICSAPHNKPFFEALSFEAFHYISDLTVRCFEDKRLRLRNLLEQWSETQQPNLQKLMSAHNKGETRSFLESMVAEFETLQCVVGCSSARLAHSLSEEVHNSLLQSLSLHEFRKSMQCRGRSE